MEGLKKFFIKLDHAIEEFTKISLVAMIIIVTLQVFSRKLLNYSFSWSMDVTMILLIWFSFLGIAIGFREGVHLAFHSLVAVFSPKWKRIIDIMNGVLGIIFGIFLIYYGTIMAINDLGQTVPSLSHLGIPMTIRSIIIPISGIIIIVYSVLHLLGINTVRYKDMGGH